MDKLDRLKISTKLYVLVGVLVGSLLVAMLLSAFFLSSRMMDDRVGMLRAEVERFLAEVRAA